MSKLFLELVFLPFVLSLSHINYILKEQSMLMDAVHMNFYVHARLIWFLNICEVKKFVLGTDEFR